MNNNDEKINIPPIVVEDKIIFLKSTNFIFNIITTKRNKTEIAPTYTIKKIKAKKIASNCTNKNIKKITETIKKSTECIGFFALTEIKADIKIILAIK